MALENYERTLIGICTDCTGYNEYGIVGDWASTTGPTPEEQAATEKHAAKIAAIWPEGTVFTPSSSEPWFSHESCDECGDADGGPRERATAHEPPDLRGRRACRLLQVREAARADLFSEEQVTARAALPD